MSSRLNNITAKVWYLLDKYPETRNSDRTLILYYYSEFEGIFNTPFNRVMENTELTSFESIRRARQKIQEEHPEYRAVKSVEDVRIAKQEEFIEYALGE